MSLGESYICRLARRFYLVLLRPAYIGVFVDALMGFIQHYFCLGSPCFKAVTRVFLMR